MVIGRDGRGGWGVHGGPKLDCLSIDYKSTDTRLALAYQLRSIEFGMPIRIPTNQEQTTLVGNFRASLRTDPLAEIVARMLRPEACFCLDAATREAIANNILNKFEIRNSTCVFVGSAQLGFSTTKKENKPRYRAFSIESDIDIAIVSSDFYDRIWEDTFLHFIENRPWPHFSKYQKYFFRGWIRPDKLPYNTDFRSTWFDYFRNLSRDLFDSEHEIRCGLYKSNLFLNEYHKVSVKECIDAEEIR